MEQKPNGLKNQHDFELKPFDEDIVKDFLSNDWHR